MPFPNYILRDREPVPCNDIFVWAKFMEENGRRVAFTDLGDGQTVSTVFLGLDHRHWGEGAPILFETMVFGGPHDQDIMVRYTTWDEAVIGHEQVVESVRNGGPVPNGTVEDYGLERNEMPTIAEFTDEMREQAARAAEETYTEEEYDV